MDPPRFSSLYLLILLLGGGGWYGRGRWVLRVAGNILVDIAL